MTKIRTNLLNPISPEEYELLPDHVLAIEDGRIADLRPWKEEPDPEAENALDSIMLPGFIDLHVHLSQYPARGLNEPNLLPWLQKHIFPTEVRSRDPLFAKALAEEFFQAMFDSGTTAAVVYTSSFPQACDAAMEVALKMGARAMIGMTLMDRNVSEEMLQTTAQAFEESIGLYQKWHGKSPLLDYIFTPRFAPVCSCELMKLIGDFANQEHAWIQSHLSENKDEITWVQELFGGRSYTQVYQDCGILGPRTIMAHSIHLSDNEIELLKDTDTVIAHCPDSNFFLKSGEFQYQKLWDRGLRIALGSDVAAGSTLNMRHHAKMANYRQSALNLPPSHLLWQITLGAAKALGWQDITGSIEPGKEADLCLYQIPAQYALDETLLSRFIYLPGEFELKRTYVRGRLVSSN